MIISMLQGVSEMLKDTKEVEVKCAKIMLDKIIDGMCREDVKVVSSPTSPQKDKPKQGHQPPPQESNEPEYIVAVENGILLGIKYQGESGVEEAEFDLAIEVDGKITTYGAAKGNKFTSGRIL